MRIFSLLLMLVLVGAGCSTPVSDVPSAQPASTTETAAETQTTNILTYAMSSGIVLFTAPENWFVRQADAGGGSVITIQATKDDEEGMDILVANPWSTDGVEVTYEQWLAKYSFTESLGSREIGGYTFSEYDIQVNGKSLTAYTAVIDEVRPLYIKIQVRTESPEITDVLSSLAFFPSEEVQSSAQPIPEWQLSDRE